MATLCADCGKKLSFKEHFYYAGKDLCRECLRVLEGTEQSAKTLFCPNCGSVGLPTTRNKGSTGVEIVLWLFFVVPGLIYSVWRRSAPASVCPKCGAPNMIPTDSPRAQSALGTHP